MVLITSRDVGTQGAPWVLVHINEIRKTMIKKNNAEMTMFIRYPQVSHGAVEMGSALKFDFEWLPEDEE